MGKRILRTVTKYIDKPPCKTAAQMEALCCEEMGELQCCEISEPWDGFTDDEIIKMNNIVLDEDGKNAEGYKVKIVRLPRNNPCGKKIIKYTFKGKNCCEDIPALEINADESDDVIEQNWVGIITLKEKSVKEVSVSVRGTGFYGSREPWHKDVVYSAGASQVWVYTDDTACGSGTITIQDGCSSITCSMRCTAGKWEVVGTGGSKYECFDLESLDVHLVKVDTTARYQVWANWTYDGYLGRCDQWEIDPMQQPPSHFGLELTSECGETYTSGVGTEYHNCTYDFEGSGWYQDGAVKCDSLPNTRALPADFPGNICTSGWIEERWVC